MIHMQRFWTKIFDFAIFLGFRPHTQTQARTHTHRFGVTNIYL